MVSSSNIICSQLHPAKRSLPHQRLLQHMQSLDLIFRTALAELIDYRVQQRYRELSGVCDDLGIVVKMNPAVTVRVKTFHRFVTELCHVLSRWNDLSRHTVPRRSRRIQNAKQENADEDTLLVDIVGTEIS